MGAASATRCAVWAAVALPLIAGCPRPRPTPIEPPTNTTISVEVEGDSTPDLDNREPFSLPEPPAPDPGKPHLRYLTQIETPIQAAWRTFLDDCRLRLPAGHALNDVSLTATLEIDLDPIGAVVAVRSQSSSGNPDFDQVALEIVREAQRFAKPPADLVSDDGMIHVSWEFSRGASQAGAATAELSIVKWPPQRSVPRLIAQGNLAEAAHRVELASVELDPADTVQRELLIGLLNDVAIEAVREGLSSDEPKLQRLGVAAARTGKLVSLGDELLVIARGAVDVSLRHQAIRALGRVELAGAKPMLLEVLGNGPDPAAASAAATALSELGETAAVQKTAATWLASSDESQRWAALAVLASVPNPSIVKPLSALLAGKSSRAEKLAAAASLGAAATVKARGALTALIKGLRSPDAAVRASCAQAIEVAARSGIRSRLAFGKLVALFGDKDDRVRASAVSAAARLEARRFAAELSRLDKEQSKVVLEALARSLGAAVPGKPARARLSELAAHSEAVVRRSAARALIELDDPEARVVLSSLLEDTDFEVRLIVVGGLRDVEALSRYLDHESPAVRAAALNQLVAEKGKGKTLAEVSRRLATATLTLDRVLLAAAWLSR
jgi:TonB family protein